MFTIKKAFAFSVEEMEKLTRDGYHVVSMSYFISNPVMHFIMEKE